MQSISISSDLSGRGLQLTPMQWIKTTLLFMAQIEVERLRDVKEDPERLG